METRIIFSQRLKELREEQGWSLQNLADNLEVSRASVGYYEKGERVPDIEVLVSISKLFNVSTDYLLGLTDIKNTSLDVKIACKVTGLSESAVKALLGYSEIPAYLISLLLTGSRHPYEFFRLLYLYCDIYSKPTAYRKCYDVGEVSIKDIDLPKIYKSLLIDEFSHLIEFMAKDFNGVNPDEYLERDITFTLSAKEMDLEDE